MLMRKKSIGYFSADTVGGGVGKNNAAGSFKLLQFFKQCIKFGIADKRLGAEIVCIRAFVKQIDKFMHSISHNYTSLIISSGT